jgi:hypothetical protein
MAHSVHEKVPAILQMDYSENLLVLIVVDSVLPRQQMESTIADLAYGKDEVELYLPIGSGTVILVRPLHRK